MIVYYSSLFQYFFIDTLLSHSCQKFLIFCILVCELFKICLVNTHILHQSNGAIHPSYINNCLESGSVVFITPITAMFNLLLHSSTNQELFKNVTRVATVKIWKVPCARYCTHLVLSKKLSTLYTSLSARFNSIHSSMNQERFKKHLCNQSSHH